MHKSTGDGKLRHEPTRAIPRARLYNFDINSDKLKAAHQTWLDQSVARQLKAPEGAGKYIVIQGTASRTGNAGHNAHLSQQRAEQVRRHLIKQGVPPERILLFFSGEAFSEGKREEDEIDRSVLVTVADTKSLPPKPQPPKLQPPKPQLTSQPHTWAPPAGPQKFAIRILRAVELGPVVTATFEIRDFGNPPMTAYYEFRGLSIGISFPISISTRGGWNEFTPRLRRSGVKPSEFWGPMRWASAGLPPLPDGPAGRSLKSIGATALVLDGVPGVPQEFIPFNDGTTYGSGGMGVTAGILTPHPLLGLTPYPGPEGP